MERENGQRRRRETVREEKRNGERRGERKKIDEGGREGRERKG